MADHGEQCFFCLFWFLLTTEKNLHCKICFQIVKKYWGTLVLLSFKGSDRLEIIFE